MNRIGRILTGSLAALCTLAVTVLAVPPRRMTGYETLEAGADQTFWHSWRFEEVEIRDGDTMQVLHVDRFDPARSEVRFYVRDPSGRRVLRARTPVSWPEPGEDGLHHSYNFQPLD